uniref:Uncharacterized protein n=1 Tax=Rhizophora mucronata TaxID=61149 RepID=A0A2P2R1B4_RHIMU
MNNEKFHYGVCDNPVIINVKAQNNIGVS